MTIAQSFQTEWMPLIAAVIGALVGGMISGLVAYWGQTVVLARDQEQRDAHDRKCFISLLYKYQKISGILFTLHKFHEQCLEKITNEMNEYWMVMVPNIGAEINLPDLTAEELAVLAENGSAGLASELSLLQERVKNDEAGQREYSRLRFEFAKQIPAKMKGNIGSSELNREEFERLRPRMIEMNTLAVEVMKNTYYDLIEAERLGDEINHMISKLPKSKTIVKFEFSQRRISEPKIFAGDDVRVPWFKKIFRRNSAKR